jgi:hypothetical protein
MGPDVPGICGSLPFAGGAERLARVAAGDDVDRFHRAVVDGGEVPEVGHAGEAVGEDAGGAGVVVGGPGERAAEDVLCGHVQAAVSGAQRAET